MVEDWSSRRAYRRIGLWHDIGASVLVSLTYRTVITTRTVVTARERQALMASIAFALVFNHAHINSLLRRPVALPEIRTGRSFLRSSGLIYPSIERITPKPPI